uniref:Phosphoinositide phosphatase SAC8 isoform X1 n=1 Tax=Rhizophora mucronata TaxID=61149 RepID=A0A2P2LJ54_RHIMU
MTVVYIYLSACCWFTSAFMVV